MLTGAMLRLTGVKTVGLCHSVQVCASTLLKELGMPYDDTVQWKIAGINHQAWLLELTRDGHLHIRNWGDRPFTEGGLLSIMRSHLSTKSQTAYRDATIRPIGHKGLGFRSLLNWSDEITIRSNGVSCSFSATIARQYWQEIKQEARLDEAVATLFEEASPGGLPLPILAIPRVSRDNLTAVLGETDGEERCTTDVEVHCKNPTVRADIVEKLFDNFSIDFEYENGVHLHSMCRQIDGCSNNVSESVHGTKGYWSSADHAIRDLQGNILWQFNKEAAEAEFKQIGRASCRERV